MTITANVEDAAGNAAEEAKPALTTDFNAGITIETIAGKDVGDAGTEITAADRVGGFDVTGTVADVENGQPVTVTVNGRTSRHRRGGAFTVEISARLPERPRRNGP